MTGVIVAVDRPVDRNGYWIDLERSLESGDAHSSAREVGRRPCVRLGSVVAVAAAAAAAANQLCIEKKT